MNEDMMYFRAPRAAFEALATEIQAPTKPGSYQDAAWQLMGATADTRLLALLEPVTP